ncbi:PCYOX1 [Symbiodinium natans]|uniref:PCYOX1 protein n=1 Tax=Symbiodinium natans TaxID=878477 RepID=A0A812QWG8_9DINO|nr:PCYOX1 [Symbiodinium natans]
MFKVSDNQVFEKSAHVGGRARLFHHAGSSYEAGASIIHIQNRYLVEFAAEFGLGQLQPVETRLGLHDGRDLLFETSDRRAVTLARMLWRYGLGPLRLDRWVSGFLKKFEQVYRLQKEGKAFSTPRRLLASLDSRFSQMLDETLEERLNRDGFDRRLIQELASGMVRVNYGQGLEIGAFVGAVALCGSQGPLWAVEGGNQALASKILESSGAILRQAAIRRVEVAGSRYRLHADVVGEPETMFGDYDLVFLAAPLQDGQALQLPSTVSLQPSLYQRIYATFFDAPPDAKALGSSGPVPGILLSSTGQGFNSIGLHNSSRRGDGKLIWKVFSPAPLTEEQSKELFPNAQKCETFGWWAYPKYEVRDAKSKDTDFCLDGAGLYYCNAIEETASAMEMAVLGAKNCVLLASHRWKGTRSNIDPAPAARL